MLEPPIFRKHLSRAYARCERGLNAGDWSSETHRAIYSRAAGKPEVMARIGSAGMLPLARDSGAIAITSHEPTSQD
jgi:hypothetical protein